MEVRIRIIDTLEDTHVYTLEKAEGGSIIVDWKGSDRKDDLNIVGSTLAVTMAKLSREDGAYYDLFTGDETRYRVIMDLADESYTIWQGFLLPDSYSEPYSNSPILVDVVATDGLGRLKGKFLPETFYIEENSIIQIITECLRLTGVGLDLRFAPAIENYQQKDWDTIYLPGEFFTENDGKKDAYQILESILPLNCIYQADNYWNIEGYNIREQRVYTTKVYTSEGVFVEEQEITRLRKDITGTGKPDITMQPPYGVIEVSHEREPIELPEGIVTVDNEGWKNYDSYNDGVIALDWYGQNGFWAESQRTLNTILTLDDSNKDDIIENVFFGRRADNEEDQSLSLRQRPYIQEGKKYRIKLDFEIIPFSEWDDTQDYIDAINAGYWTNPFFYSIRVGETEVGLENIENWLVYNNFFFPDTYRNVAIQFDEDLNSENEFTFIARRSGLLNITLGPIGELAEVNRIGRIQINAAEIENLDFEEELISQSIINEDYTLKKEIELEYSDGATGVSKSYRLDKLDEANTGDFQQFIVNPIRQFWYNGQFYSSVKLKDANLIKENLEYSYASAIEAELIDVIYNFQESQEHVVITDIETGTFVVQVLDYNRVTYDRFYWEQWTDSLFKIEKDRFNDVLVNINSRLFNAPLASMNNVRAKNNIKFNDFLGFDWRNVTEWVITNCKWDVDRGFSDVSMTQRYYTSDDALLPPIVDVPNIQYYTDTTSYVVSETYAPSGFIVSWFWEVVEGTGVNINAPNASETLIYVSPGEEYAKVRVTVTDNNGNTSFDEVELIKEFNVNLSVTQVSSDSNIDVYELDPINIGENAVLNLRGKILVRIAAIDKTLLDDLYVSIKQNGQEVSNVFLIFGTDSQPDASGNVPRRGLEEEYSINYRKGDTIQFEINVASLDGFGQTYGFFTLDYAEYIVGNGDIYGYPIKEDKFLNSQ